MDGDLPAERDCGVVPPVEQVWSDADGHVERRALIEQTKGMLMLVYGIDAEAAFDLLRTHSQRHNIKLRLIAEQILKDLVELSASKGAGRRLDFDSLMLTAHLRIAHVAERQLDGVSKTGVPMKDLGVSPSGPV